MKFNYEYRTKSNELLSGSLSAPSRDAAFAALKSRGIHPSRVVEAPGFFNHLWGKGKRWIAIGVLSLVAAAAVLVAWRARHSVDVAAGELSSLSNAYDSPIRRQPIGDAVVIEKGIRTGWDEVFKLEGDRFLAGFAVPGVPVAVRSTSQAAVNAALAEETSLAPDAPHPLEARQIVAMVRGMKAELRKFIADGGTLVEYGRRLVQRQEQEIGYYQRAKAELEQAKKGGMPDDRLMELWEKRNAALRAMGIKLVPLPE